MKSEGKALIDINRLEHLELIEENVLKDCKFFSGYNSSISGNLYYINGYTPDEVLKIMKDELEINKKELQKYITERNYFSDELKSIRKSWYYKLFG